MSGVWKAMRSYRTYLFLLKLQPCSESPALGQNTVMIYSQDMFLELQLVQINFTNILCDIIYSSQPILPIHDGKQYVEAQENRVILHEIKFHAFEEVLRYIYTSEIRNLDKFPSEVLKIADMVKTLRYHQKRGRCNEKV